MLFYWWSCESKTGTKMKSPPPPPLATPHVAHLVNTPSWSDGLSKGEWRSAATDMRGWILWSQTGGITICCLFIILLYNVSGKWYRMFQLPVTHALQPIRTWQNFAIPCKKKKKETWQPCFSHSIISIKHINHIQNELILILIMNVHQYISWLLMSMYHYISLLSINVHHYASWWLMNVCQYISWLVLVTNVCHYVSWLLMTVHHYMSWLLMNGHHYISWKFCSEFFH